MWLLFSFLFATVLARLYCGLDPLTNFMMEVHIKLDCKKIVAAHNSCCLEHGFCYLKRRPYEFCDNSYCECIAPLASEGICKFHGDNFCNLVKNNGKNVYPMFTMENGRK